MSKRKSRRQSLVEWLGRYHYVVIRDEESLAQQFRWRFTWARALLIGVGALALFSGLLFFLAWRTADWYFERLSPSQRLRRQIVTLSLSLDSLSEASQAQARELQNLRQVLNGEAPQAPQAQGQASTFGEVNLSEAPPLLKEFLATDPRRAGGQAVFDSLLRKRFEPQGIQGSYQPGEGWLAQVPGGQVIRWTVPMLCLEADAAQVWLQGPQGEILHMKGTWSAHVKAGQQLAAGAEALTVSGEKKTNSPLVLRLFHQGRRVW